LAVRMAYACLSVFEPSQRWSPLNGDLAPFILMHSIMEYVVVVICVTCGYLIQPTKRAAAMDNLRDQGA